MVAPEHTGNRFVDNYALGITGFGCETLLSRPCRDDNAKSAVDRPQDIRFVLDQVLAGNASVDPAVIDASRIGMYGHSFGGYTTLAVAGGTVSGALPDSRIKAIAPLSPLASASAVSTDPGLVPLTGNIEVPTLVSFGTADHIFGINFVDQGREIFTDLDTRAVGEKYRVEIRRGVHSGIHGYLRLSRWEPGGDSARERQPTLIPSTLLRFSRSMAKSRRCHRHLLARPKTDRRRSARPTCSIAPTILPCGMR